MTGKERIKAALNHTQPDQVPVDFGGCMQTTIHVSVIACLRNHFGLEKRRVKVDEPYTMMGQIDEDLKVALGVDVDTIPGYNTFFGVPRDEWKEFVTMSDQELEWLKDRMKESGSSERATLAAVPGAGLGDIACVPGPWMKDPKGIRDIQEWYMSTVLRKDYLHELFSRQTDVVITNLKKMFAALGNNLDIAWVCGTDFGTQNSTFCSLETFNELYKPYYQKTNNWIHENTEWKTFKHCCGAVEGFMEGFIESGFDIINPVQWTADGMEPKLLKEKYGSRITFWGGGVNTQATLPFGKPEQVREEVLRSCEVFAPGGGFVFNTIHNIQAGTPVANVVAMLDALKEFNRN